MHSTIPIIRNWSIQPSSRDPYRAPETVGISVAGNVYGHSSRPDGERIVTSRVVDADGRVVTTKSGSTYRLGTIDPKYRAWLREQKRAYNPNQPIAPPVTPNPPRLP